MITIVPSSDVWRVKVLCNWIANIGDDIFCFSTINTSSQVLQHNLHLLIENVFITLVHQFFIWFVLLLYCL